MCICVLDGPVESEDTAYSLKQYCHGISQLFSLRAAILFCYEMCEYDEYRYDVLIPARVRAMS